MSLINGGPLIVEDLDLAGIGMYTQEQKDKFLAEGVLETDFFLKTILGETRWARYSDEGVKWHVFKDTGLKLWKDIK